MATSCASIAMVLRLRRRAGSPLIAHDAPLPSVAIDDLPELQTVQATVQAVSERVDARDASGAAEQFVEEVALGPGAGTAQPLRETMVDGALAFVAEQKDPMWAHSSPRALGIQCPVLLTRATRARPCRPIVAKLADAIEHAEVHAYVGAGHAHIAPSDHVAAAATSSRARGCAKSSARDGA